MGKIRQLRLITDQKKIYEFARQNPYFSVLDQVGEPPSQYLFLYQLNGYLNTNAQIAPTHMVKLAFPLGYPIAEPPKLTFLNKLFHPNVYANGEVCHGWTIHNWNASVHIEQFLILAAQLITYNNNAINFSNPANTYPNPEWIKTHPKPPNTVVITENFNFENSTQQPNETEIIKINILKK